MAIVKWDPLRELRLMQDQMTRLLDSSRNFGGEPLEEGLWQPPVDIYEDDREVVVKMEVPEVDQKDIQVQIEDNILIIHGERKLEREEKKHNYHRIECFYGNFRRTFALPASVDQDKVVAHCDKGMLKIVLPKRAESKPRQIDVEIKP
jgi:HSP20 family protein